MSTLKQLTEEYNLPIAKKCELGLQRFFKPNERDGRLGVPGVVFSQVNQNDVSGVFLLVICGNVRIEAGVTDSGAQVFARSQIKAKGNINRQPVRGVVIHTEGWPIYLRDGIDRGMSVKVILDN